MGTGWMSLEISDQKALPGPNLSPNPVCSERKKKKEKATVDG